MSHLPFIHARFPDPSVTERTLVHHLRQHLADLRTETLRQHEVARPPEAAPEDAGEPEGDEDAFDLENDLRARVVFSTTDIERINRRAARLHWARIAVTGLNHLKKEERERPEVSLDDLTGFTRREGLRRGLSEASIEAIVEVLRRMSRRGHRLDLRVVIRMLDRAERLEGGPPLQ